MVCVDAGRKRFADLLRSGPQISEIHGLTVAPREAFWCEGVSFRRSAAEAVGCIPGSYPVRFCRDNMLGALLTESGCNKRVDHTIVMEHVVPDSLSGFWRQRVWHGTMPPPNFYYFRGMPIWLILLRETAKALRTLLFHLTPIPSLWRARRYASWVGGGAASPAWRSCPRWTTSRAWGEASRRFASSSGSSA